MPHFDRQVVRVELLSVALHRGGRAQKYVALLKLEKSRLDALIRREAGKAAPTFRASRAGTDAVESLIVPAVLATFARGKDGFVEAYNNQVFE